MRTFFDSRDSNNDFHDMLCISNLAYKVSENFCVNSYDHTTNISRYMRGKWSFIRNFQNETLRESRMFYHFASTIMQYQNEFPQFSNDSSMASNFEECDLGNILRSSCFYFGWFRSSLFEKFQTENTLLINNFHPFSRPWIFPILYDEFDFIFLLMYCWERCNKVSSWGSCWIQR